MVAELADGMTIRIGPHVLVRDGSILKVMVDGELKLPEMQELLTHYQALLDEQGYVLLAIHVAQARDMSLSARKAGTEWGKRHGHLCRIAVIGAPLIIRTAIELMNRAANVLARRSRQLLPGFFATEEEARQWLLAQTPSLQQLARKS